MTAHAAALYVCGAAKDADDARHLLTVLGLLDGGRIVEPPAYQYQPIVDIKDVAATGAGGRNYQ